MSKLDDPKGTVRFPVSFDTFKHIKAASDRFAPDMQCSFFPETEPSPHKDVFRLL